MLAVMVYFVAHCILQNEIRWADFVVGLHDFQALGNPTWFILVTLLTYVLTYVCFVLVGGETSGGICPEPDGVNHSQHLPGKQNQTGTLGKHHPVFSCRYVLLSEGLSD